MIDIDHPAIQVGVGALFGQHPERGGQERVQAVFSVLNAVIEAGYLVEPFMSRGEGTHEMKFQRH